MSACRNPLPAWYPIWEAWRLSGALPKERPHGLPVRIPDWAWSCFKERRPKPVTPTYWQNGKPGVFLTNGWTLGFGPTQRKLSASQLVAELKSAIPGLGWVATQDEATTPTQAAPFCAACRNALITPGIWEAAVDFGSPVKAAAGYDFYIGQVEGPNQFDRLATSKAPAVPHAVVTNFGGVGPAEASILIGDGYYALVESHIKESPATPAGQVDYATRVLGWPAHMVSPMVGLGGGATLADYPGIAAFPGWSVFAAEELLT